MLLSVSLNPQASPFHDPPPKAERDSAFESVQEAMHSLEGVISTRILFGKEGTVKWKYFRTRE